jgi:hypothetical protein
VTQILPPRFAERKRKYRDHRMPPASGRGAKRGDTSQLKPAHPVNGEVHNFLPHEDFFGDAAAILRDRIRSHSPTFIERHDGRAQLPLKGVDLT